MESLRVLFKFWFVYLRQSKNKGVIYDAFWFLLGRDPSAKNVPMIFLSKLWVELTHGAAAFRNSFRLWRVYIKLDRESPLLHRLFWGYIGCPTYVSIDWYFAFMSLLEDKSWKAKIKVAEMSLASIAERLSEYKVGEDA